MPHKPSTMLILIGYARTGSLLLMILGSAFFLPTSLCIHYFFNPDWRCYFISMIPRSNPWYVHLYIFYGLQYYFLISGVFFCVSFLGILFLSISILMFPLIRNELRPNRKSYMTLNSLRQPGTVTEMYRTLEILMKLCNQALRPVILPLQSLTGQFSMFCNVTLITHWDSLDIMMRIIFFVWTLITAGAWVIVLQCGGWLYGNAGKTTRSWKNVSWSKPDKKYLSKFRKSCRPMGVRVEERYGQYCMKRVTVLKYIKGLSKGTLGALMALKKDQ